MAEIANVKEINFDKGEMDELQELQSNYQQKQLEFGQIKVQKILLEQQVDALETREQELQSEYEGLQKKERDLVQKYIDKYGPGNLDPNTGIFTPTS